MVAGSLALTLVVASHFGGTRQGMAIAWPKVIKDVGGIRSQFHHMIDIVPTILEVTDIPAPTTVNGIPRGATARQAEGIAGPVYGGSKFQLGADIVSTTISPSLEDLTKLAIIAVIRTFLNYFLEKELKEVVNNEN